MTLPTVLPWLLGSLKVVKIFEQKFLTQLFQVVAVHLFQSLLSFHAVIVSRVAISLQRTGVMPNEKSHKKSMLAATWEKLKMQF